MFKMTLKAKQFPRLLSSYSKEKFANDRSFINELLRGKCPQAVYTPKKILVEFSSPNIAKPFHVGHLRSTIIGNFISNVNEYLSNKVIRINYLGDWGTQFGLLKVGVDLSGYTDEMIKKDPIQLLYKAYVMANKCSETDPNVVIKAREIFQQLEEGNLPDLQRWHSFRGYTVEELQKVYNRLGVVFDEYNWESMYSSREISAVLKALHMKNLIHKEDNGKQVINVNSNRKVTIVKSDGSTLYITRDIAAAIDRSERYQFDHMYYVVENAQTDHFNALFGIISKLDLPWADQMTHIKFGRVHGMSTRKGNVIFLKDILDEAKDIMKRKQLETHTTKVEMGRMSEMTADVLGVSAVIINDLKQRRQRDYEFDWNRVLQVQGDTGVKLQYTHCRLCSLYRYSGATLPSARDDTALQEPQAVALYKHLLAFNDAIVKAHQELEACILVSYLFQLCALINKALKVLPIKNQDLLVGSQRLLLFHLSRLVLNRGMGILGLHPLSEM